MDKEMFERIAFRGHETRFFTHSEKTLRRCRGSFGQDVPESYWRNPS